MRTIYCNPWNPTNIQLKNKKSPGYFLSICQIGLLAGLMAFSACKNQPENNTARAEFPVITLGDHEADSIARKIREESSAVVAEGWELSLWASDSLLADPVAISMDDAGRAYVTNTNRRRRSEFDIRRYREWMTTSISFTDVEDRRAFIREQFATELSAQNAERMEDKNGDGVHDWRDLMVDKERVLRIEDASGDGLADNSRVYTEAITEEISDVACGMLVYDNDVFLAVAPDLWRITDHDGDGTGDETTSISHGYAVHIGFGGHNMSGVTLGPDGKVYWGIGDIGSHIIDQEGKEWNYPNQGAIFRANPDGSDFEVYAAGLRNTHEFDFDEFGNIISVDNDGDHPGESERLVYLVNGGDSGWRINWQFGKYTDPENNQYKVWMDENYYVPRWEGQAAHILPPIRNYHNGPTGLKYNPGTALSEKYYDQFFFAEFTGTPARSNVYAFKVEEEGAGFRFVEDEKILSNILITGLDFGPDGSLYIADWIDGWEPKEYGRIWKLDIPGESESQIRKNVKSLLAEDFSEKSAENLFTLLGHQDQRIRLKAQFSLVAKGKSSLDVFQKALEQRNSRMARVHAIWGIAQLAREDISMGENLTPLLADEDAEIRAQAAKMIGDVRYGEAAGSLIVMLEDIAPRPRFFAAEALGRIAYGPAVQPIIEMLAANDDQDVYLRHAGSLALARIGNPEPLVALADHPSFALRRAAVVALRRMGHPGVAKFLYDANEYNVADAARAINDDYSIEPALPDLAGLLNNTSFQTEPIIRRAINANLRVGKEENLTALAEYAARKDVPETLRAEAIAVIGGWAKPSVTDRVDGRYRGEITRDPAIAQSKTESLLAGLKQDPSPAVRIALVEAAARLKLNTAIPVIKELFENDRNTEVRIASLNSLFALGYEELDNMVQLALQARDQNLRMAGLDLTPQLSVDDAAKAKLLSLVMGNSSVGEQQSALGALGKLPGDVTEGIFSDLLDDLSSGKIIPEIKLELKEAIQAGGTETMQKRLEEWQESQKARGVLAEYADALYGGNARRGQRVIYGDEASQCTRCHPFTPGKTGVGPNLHDVATRLGREKLLESVVDPSAEIAPGFGAVSLKMKDGSTRSGIIMEENNTSLLLKTGATEPERIARSDIETRTNAPSSMPPIGSILSHREIRDLVEYLTTLKPGDT